MTETRDDLFTLANDPPASKPWKGADQEKRQQGVLFTGLDCLPDQQDLFDEQPPPLPTVTCPKGHVIDLEPDVAPECHTCRLIAVHLDRKTPKVLEWMPRADYDAAAENLQDQLDAAFDNQYFGGGW